MTRSDIVERAQSSIGRGCIYQLGKGGMKPDSPAPWDGAFKCDCSGFASWCIGQSRQTKNPHYVNRNGGWLETTEIVFDAKGIHSGMFHEMSWLDAEPGDLLVYGDSNGRQGHIGIVSEVDADGPSKVIHCSSGNFKHFKDAIQETGVGAFKLRNAIVARYRHVGCDPENCTHGP